MQFRHFGFESGYQEGGPAFTAQSGAMIPDRLARFAKSGITTFLKVEAP